MKLPRRIMTPLAVVQKVFEVPKRPPAPKPVDDELRIETLDRLGVLQSARDDPHRDAISLLVSLHFQQPMHRMQPASKLESLCNRCHSGSNFSKLDTVATRITI